MKKIFGAVLVLIMCSVMLTGCLFFDDSGDGVSNGGASGNSTILSYNIKLPSVPATYAYGYDDFVYSKVKITSVSYEVDYGYLTLYISGEKIYDSEGNNNSEYCAFGYKIYDSENYVVDSGMIITDGLRVGEKFRNFEYATLCELERGESYRVVFENYTI